MDIDGLGEKLVDQLVEKEMVTDPSALYRLTVDDLVPLERMARKSAENLVAAIDRSRRTTLPRLLYALGIRHVGEASAIALASHFRSLEAVANATEEQLVEVADVGPAMAQSIRAFFEAQENRRVLEKLEQGGVAYPEPEPVESREGPLAGMVLVFTGELEGMSRAEARRLAESRGAEVAGSVTRKVTHVVAGSAAGSKLEAARKKGLPILSEEEFMKLTGR